MSVEAIHQLRIRSNDFVNSIDQHIANVVDNNQKLLQLNKGQMQASKNAKGGALLNNRTGSTTLSAGYAKRKGKKKPNIFDTGDTYRGLDIAFVSPNEYLIDSNTSYTKYLEEMYDNLFGVADRLKAYKITVPLLREEYIKTVLNK